jgi:O-antigen/teichoic acid export membrane protein
MKKKIVRDISASSLQVVINQLSGILLFYFCSKFLDKGTFGELNWSIAVLITAFNILGFGMDQLMVRKIAAGGDAAALIRLYLLHVIFAGLGFYAVLLAGVLVVPEFYRSHHLVIALGVSQLLLFLTMPFKQAVTGKEQFRTLLFMSICSNIIKAVGVPLLAYFDKLTTELVIGIFIFGSAIELMICIYLSRMLLRNSLKPGFNRNNYLLLVRESLPQLGTIIFNSAVARFDWILLGLISTDIVLAEYSFAYRAFEVSTLPLLVLGPLLLPKFSRLFHSGEEPDLLGGRGELLLLLRLEMLIACGTVLVVNMLWNPLIDSITGGKYGAVNTWNILILTCSIPLLYLNNFLWTVHFARGRLRMLFIFILITFAVNAAGDFALIPFFKGLGAAIAYSFALLVQTVIYVSRTRLGNMKKFWELMFINIGSVLISGSLAEYFFHSPGLRTLIAVATWLILVTAAGQLRLSQWRTLKTILSV